MVEANKRRRLPHLAAEETKPRTSSSVTASCAQPCLFPVSFCKGLINPLRSGGNSYRSRSPVFKNL